MAWLVEEKKNLNEQLPSFNCFWGVDLFLTVHFVLFGICLSYPLEALSLTLIWNLNKFPSDEKHRKLTLLKLNFQPRYHTLFVIL